MRKWSICVVILIGMFVLISTASALAHTYPAGQDYYQKPHTYNSNDPDRPDPTEANCQVCHGPEEGNGDPAWHTHEGVATLKNTVHFRNRATLQAIKVEANSKATLPMGQIGKLKVTWSRGRRRQGPSGPWSEAICRITRRSLGPTSSSWPPVPIRFQAIVWRSGLRTVRIRSSR